jgi:hypothetical protein
VQGCSTCDTLRTDADDGDECVNCGAVYADFQRRAVYVPAPAPVKVDTVPTLVARSRRGVSYRHINGFRR